jgi:membrane associated rhomboid family serine protease
MLILPLHRRPGGSAIPWATLLLVALNVGVFFGLQSGDTAAFERAASYYHGSGLSGIEAPEIGRFLESRGKRELASEVLALPEPTRSTVLLRATEGEPGLGEAIRAGTLLPDDHPRRADWQAQRARLGELLDERFTDRHLLRYDAPRAASLLSSAFLHGDLSHLVGNMVFLVLLGLLVEGALGAGWFLALYGVAALGSGGFSLLLHLGQPGGALGASGAIAGLMGAYCVLWGLRRVRVFYWFFVVMGQARVVALWLLPFWLGWELWQWAGAEQGVAFDAHAGGIMTGALAAFGLRAAGRERRDFLDHEVVEDEGVALFARAKDALGKLDFARAREAVSALHALRPDDLAVHELRYRAWRASPDDAAFHDSARRLLLDARRAGRSAAEHVALFEDYLVAARKRTRLSAAELLLLSRRWAAAAQFEAAERLLVRMAERAPGTEGLAEASFELWLAARERAPEVAHRARALLEQRLPDSPQAAKFRAMG